MLLNKLLKSKPKNTNNEPKNNADGSLQTNSKSRSVEKNK